MKEKTGNMMAHWVERNYFDVLDCKFVNCDACSNIKLNAKELEANAPNFAAAGFLGSLEWLGKAERPSAIAGEGGRTTRRLGA